jgi:uncharacterized membrane protein
LVGLLARMTAGTALIVVIAEGVEYWRSLYYPGQQWIIVPLVMLFTILAITFNLWRLMRHYDIRKITENNPSPRPAT